MPNRMQYAFCCVDVERKDVGALQRTIAAARSITFETFAKHCNWTPWAKEHGYQVGKGNDLRLKDDWAVSFYRSKWKGQTCYYIGWSAIENIFLRGEHNA